jgi:hypothetical protein
MCHCKSPVAWRRRGVDVLTAQEDNADRLPDPQLLDRATGLGRLLFSQDADLVAEAVRRQREGTLFATVIYARQLEVSIGHCITDLEALAKAAGPDDARGQVIFL